MSVILSTSITTTQPPLWAARHQGATRENVNSAEKRTTRLRWVVHKFLGKYLKARAAGGGEKWLIRQIWRWKGISRRVSWRRVMLIRESSVRVYREHMHSSAIWQGNTVVRYSPRSIATKWARTQRGRGFPATYRPDVNSDTQFDLRSLYSSLSLLAMLEGGSACYNLNFGKLRADVTKWRGVGSAIRRTNTTCLPREHIRGAAEAAHIRWRVKIYYRVHCHYSAISGSAAALHSSTNFGTTRYGIAHSANYRQRKQLKSLEL